MDQHSLFALAAIILTVVRYGTYFHTIYQGKTKPHAFSWLLWGSATGIGAFAQFEMNAGPSIWALAAVSTGCLLIAAYSFFAGEKNFTKSDWAALIICALAIPVWQVTDNPLTAIFIVMAIDVLTYWPTVRKSYNQPHTEPPISYTIAGIRYALILCAVPFPTWETVMYPFFLMLTDWGFATYIVIRRAQLGYPLHEYAKLKETLRTHLPK